MFNRGPVSPALIDSEKFLFASLSAQTLGIGNLADVFVVKLTGQMGAFPAGEFSRFVNVEAVLPGQIKLKWFDGVFDRSFFRLANFICGFSEMRKLEYVTLVRFCLLSLQKNLDCVHIHHIVAPFSMALVHAEHVEIAPLLAPD